MGVVEKLNVVFLVSTGNIFHEDGLIGIDVPAFDGSSTIIFTSPSLQ